MDPHIWWLRRHLVRALLRPALAVFATTAVVAALLLAAAGVGRLATLMTAIVVAQAAVLLVGAWAVIANPLGYRFIRSLGEPGAGDDPLPASAPSGIDPAVVERFARTGMDPAATLWADVPGGQALYDVFRTPKGTVVGARSRASGAVTLYSRLADGRLVRTDAAGTVPHRRVVINLVANHDLASLVDAHRHVIDRAMAAGCRLVPDGGVVAAEAHTVERHALRQLGPLLGPFFDPGAVPSRRPLLINVGGPALRELGLDETRLRPDAGPAPSRHGAS